MANFIQTTTDLIIKYFFSFRHIAGGILKPALPALYVISILISGVLLWFTIYCIAGSGYVKSKIIERYMDMFGIGSVAKRRQLKAWKHVVSRMRTGDPSNWKLAILEADSVMDEVIKSSGYRGVSVDDRFKQVEPAVLSNSGELQEAHKIRNRVGQEPDFAISKEDALTILRVYKKSFQEFGLLD